MFHLVARARAGHVLWFRETEGAALFGMLTRAFPEAHALCVMPDHVHLVLPHDDAGRKLGAVMSGYTRWRNRRRKVAVRALWDKAPPPERIPDGKHLRRTIRYVHLNPCRARLADDPLAWPFSTHRDAVGFAPPGAFRVEHDPERFHAYVSGDPTVSLRGTVLPQITYDPVCWGQIEDAVAGVLRGDLHVARSGIGRRLVVQLAAQRGLREDLVRSTLGRSQRYALLRALPPLGRWTGDPLFEACVRAVGDQRFGPLSDTDLRHTSRWGRYRARA